MSKSVFVSHAVKDSQIAEAIVDLLEGGIGVPEDEIFCSSLDGYGIPTGDNFVTHIKRQLQEPEAVILILTPSYFTSNFCVSELGAAWAMSHKVFPILVPPLGYEDVKDVLLGVQVAKIDDDIKYNELRDHLVINIDCDNKSNTKWDVKRKSYLKKIESLLANIHIPKIVKWEEYIRLNAELSECHAELEKYETEISTNNEYIEELEKLKNQETVKEVKSKFNPSQVSEEFEDLVKTISEYSNILSPIVFEYVLCEKYNQPYSIDYSIYGDEFAKATRYNFISTGEEEYVNWGNKEMERLNKLLDEVENLIAEHEDLDTYHDEKYDIHFEVDNQAFWEIHYKI